MSWEFLATVRLLALNKAIAAANRVLNAAPTPPSTDQEALIKDFRSKAGAIRKRSEILQDELQKADLAKVKALLRQRQKKLLRGK